MEQRIKSFINYSGGKYKLIGQLLPEFPNSSNRMIDLFAGSGVVSANYNGAESYVVNDLNKPLVELLMYVKKYDPKTIESGIDKIIDWYGLSKTNERGYSFYVKNTKKGVTDVNRDAFLKMRNDYNAGTSDFDRALLLYALIIFGFNNQIRFNKAGKFNNPVGKRDFNDMMRKKLYTFSRSWKNKKIEIMCSDFRKVPVRQGDFVYADPPYLITTAVYNENGGWGVDDDIDLMTYLDEANDDGIKFALSNVLRHKGIENRRLENWAKKYNIIDLNKTYNNSNYHTRKGESREVLIRNY